MDRSKIKMYNHQCSDRLLISWHWQQRATLCAAFETGSFLQSSDVFDVETVVVMKELFLYAELHNHLPYWGIQVPFWTSNEIPKKVKVQLLTLSPLSWGLHGFDPSMFYTFTLSTFAMILQRQRKNFSKSYAIVWKKIILALKFSEQQVYILFDMV